MLHKYWKFQNWHVQTCGFVNHDTNGQNHGRIWNTLSFLLRDFLVILEQDFTGKTIWEILLKYGWEKVPIVNAYSYTMKIILICFCGWNEIGWKEAKHWSDVETTQQRSWFGRTNVFPWSCILGLHSKTMWNKQRYCGQLQKHVWITNFSGWNREITIPSKSTYFFMVLWHGLSCKEVCGTILWVGEQDDSTTLQNIFSMHRWPPLQRRRNTICWKIVQRMLSNCSEMLVLGTDWKTGYSMVSEQTCTVHHKMDKVCDKRLSRLMSYIHHTCDYNQYCHVGNTAKHCRLGLFQDSNFAWDLDYKNPLQEEHYVYL